MFVDTHCHLNVMVKQNFDEVLKDYHMIAIADIVKEAAAVGVERIVNIGTSISDSLESVTIAKNFDCVYATVGVHPTDTGGDRNDLKKALHELNVLLERKEEKKIVAIGEIGLDFFHKPYDKQEQTDFFKAQIELALAHDLPVVIHIREAGDEVLRVLEEYVSNGLRGVIHCFLQPHDFAQTVLDWGFYLGLDAPISYPKNEALRALFKIVPLERIVLETDAPFLPPQQYRGKQNKPAYIPLIAQELARVREVELEIIEHATSDNAQKLFWR